jgi:hypothetical protein
MRFPAFALLCAALLSGCQSGPEWERTEIVPIEPGETIHLRVAYAINDRFSYMTPEQVDIMLTAARKTVHEHFGVNVDFTTVTETHVDYLFSLISPRVLKARRSSIYDFKSGKGDSRRLAQAILGTLQQRETRLEDALAYARPYLPSSANPQTLEEFSALLADVMLERLQYWRSIKAEDGAPVLDKTPRNEWIYWDSLGYTDLPYDIVLTNQLVASAEDVAVDIHSAIRGGVTVGTTTFSRNNHFGSYVFWSTFPFTDDSDLSKSLRGGESYTDEQAAEFAGEYLAHEIGHLLFKFGHPFGQQACVMNPVSMLRFREWHEHINAAQCRIGSLPEMEVGAIPEYYNTDWLRWSTPK